MVGRRLSRCKYPDERDIACNQRTRCDSVIAPDMPAACLLPEASRLQGKHRKVWSIMFDRISKNKTTKAVERHNQTDEEDDLHGLEFWSPCELGGLPWTID